MFTNLVFYFRTVGVRTDLGCSKCDAHLGLLTNEGFNLGYLISGAAMTFSPKNKKVSVVEKVVKVPSIFTAKPPLPDIPPKLSIEQMLPKKPL